jgi:hypothetical protein
MPNAVCRVQALPQEVQFIAPLGSAFTYSTAPACAARAGGPAASPIPPELSHRPKTTIHPSQILLFIIPPLSFTEQWQIKLPNLPRHLIHDDGLYRDVRRGLSRGCPLSPLLGTLYLQALDVRLERVGLFYVRFMDDWVALAPTRWKLPHAIKLVNETLNELKLGKHPDKTFIGRIERGFDFLGYHFSPGGLNLAPQTIEQCKAPLARLYEQGADDILLRQYVRSACLGPTPTSP